MFRGSNVKITFRAVGDNHNSMPCLCALFDQKHGHRNRLVRRGRRRPASGTLAAALRLAAVLALAAAERVLAPFRGLTNVGALT